MNDSFIDVLNKTIDSKISETILMFGPALTLIATTDYCAIGTLFIAAKENNWLAILTMYILNFFS